jgi:4'-phosphopantetheinyl transferase
MLNSRRSERGNCRLERFACAQGLENQDLEDGPTYVWWIDLQVVAEIVDSVVRLLSPEERRRADRIANVEVYREFVLTRSAVRLLLARYSGCVPEELSLLTGRYGKPVVGEVGIGIEFSVSHSQGLALICLSRDRHVGVDLEYIRDMPDFDLIGKLTLTIGERTAISTALEPLEAFFSLLGAKGGRCKGRRSWLVRLAL